jgi:integrase
LALKLPTLEQARREDDSRRTVALAPAAVTMLRKHRTTQKEDKLGAGDQWTESGLVFTTELGGPVDPAQLAARRGVCRQGGRHRGCRVHTLRHSAAVGWLEAGVHIKAVADLLGHSSVAITGDVYGHTSDETARAAVAGRAASENG